MEGENFFWGSLEGGDGGGQKGFSLRGEKKNFPCRGIRGGRKKSSAGGYEGGEKPKIWVLPGQGAQQLQRLQLCEIVQGNTT